MPTQTVISINRQTPIMGPATFYPRVVVERLRIILFCIQCCQIILSIVEHLSDEILAVWIVPVRSEQRGVYDLLAGKNEAVTAIDSVNGIYVSIRNLPLAGLKHPRIQRQNMEDIHIAVLRLDFRFVLLIESTTLFHI